MGCNPTFLRGALRPELDGGSQPRSQRRILKHHPELQADWCVHRLMEQAATFPAKSLQENKCWPYLDHVGNVFGDRNPVCACMGTDNYS